MTFAVCVILACVFTGRHAAAVPRISESPVHDTTFENGLSTLLMEDRSAPLIALRIVYHVGARDEVEGKTGLAQVAGRLLTQGSLGYRKEEYGRLIHSGGGDFGFQITQDNSSFWARFPKGMLRQVLLLEADRMENPLVTREKLESAKSATLRARAAYLETNIYASLVTELLSRVYAGHPYGRFQLGSEEDIVGLGVDDVRDWLDRLVQPANATLILVGDFKRDDLLQELVEIFADIPSAARPQRDLPQMAATQSEQRSHIEGSIQIPVFIGGYEVPNMSHPDRLPLDLLASLLFGERSSRLYQSLVVRSGKCMYASGDIAEYKGPCFLYYYAFMNQGEPFADAEALLQQELQSVIGGDVSEGDLIIAKRQMEGEIYRRAARARRRGEQIADSYELWGDGMRWWENLERLEKVTLDDIARVAREYLKDEKRTIIFLNPQGAQNPEARP